MTTPGKYDVIIIGGFGHVGLPLGIVLADCGLQVGLYDTDRSKRPVLEAGRLPFIEHDAEPLLKKVFGRQLHIVDQLAAVRQADCIIVTLGTPVDEYLNPRLRTILDMAEDLAPHLVADQCLILRSTVYPGTTRSLQEYFTRLGIAIDLAYCPERIVQGFAIRELRSLPQIVSGFTARASERAAALFARLGVETVGVSVEEAELAKLFSNAWRYIQFATTNQFYMIARSHGADFARVYHAMTHNYSRADDFPRPGFAAGPCLLKDTLQLAAFYGNAFQLGHAAMMVNEGLPNFLVTQLREEFRRDLSGVRVGILGMAFKADIDDKRDALSYKLAKVLRFHGAIPVCSDEYISDPGFVSKEDVIATCPAIVVGVPHSAYRGLEVPAGVHVLDLWGAVKVGAAVAV